MATLIDDLASQWGAAVGCVRVPELATHVPDGSVYHKPICLADKDTLAPYELLGYSYYCAAVVCQHARNVAGELLFSPEDMDGLRHYLPAFRLEAMADRFYTFSPVELGGVDPVAGDWAKHLDVAMGVDHG